MLWDGIKAFGTQSLYSEPPHHNLTIHLLFIDVWWSVSQGRGRGWGGGCLCLVMGSQIVLSVYVLSIFPVLVTVGVYCLPSETFRRWFLQICGVFGIVEHSGCLYSSA